MIYLMYNNYVIIKVIETLCGTNVKNIGLWSIQYINCDNRCPIIVYSDEKTIETEKKEQLKKKRNKSLFLCQLEFIEDDRTPETKELLQENNFIINPLRAMSEICENNEISSMTNGDISQMVLGILFGIKPIVLKFNTLMFGKSNYQQFQYHIEYGMSPNISCLIDKNNTFVPLVHSTQAFWRRMHIFYCFGCSLMLPGWRKFRRRGMNGTPLKASEFDEYRGMFGLMAQLCAFGDFSYFTRYMDMKIKYNCKIDESVSIMSGMNALLCLYLRDDLLFYGKYARYWSRFDGFPLTMILFACDPSIVYQFNNRLKTYSGLSNDINSDILNDEKQFHPNHRLQFMYNLCFCSKLCVAMKYLVNQIDDGREYPVEAESALVRIEDLIEETYNNFDGFCKKWSLESYPDFRGNLDKQVNLHKKYKIIIQAMLGLTDKFACLKIDGKKESNHDIIDLLPQSETDLLKMCQRVIDNEPTLYTGLWMPEIVPTHKTERAYPGPHKLILDIVCDANKFMCSLWNLL